MKDIILITPGAAITDGVIAKAKIQFIDFTKKRDIGTQKLMQELKKLKILKTEPFLYLILTQGLV